MYGVTREFVISYIDHQQFPNLDQYQNWDEFRVGLAPLSRSYVDFAMTCVHRARDAAAQILCGLAPAQGESPKRYLDVGCGYGGFVREFASRGFDSVGVELQAHLAAFSRANCADLSNARILHGDLLQLGNDSSLGEFDLITCNDVIEHVQDATEAIRGIASLLKPGGVFFLEIPNRSCIDSVRGDGHYQQFGSVLVERHAAAALIHQMTGTDDYLQEMGEMYDLAFYRASLEEVGLKVEVRQVHKTGTLDDVPAKIALLAGEFAHWVKEARAKLNPHLFIHVRLQFAEYMERLWKGYAEAVQGRRRREFELSYLTSFWTVIAQKP